MQFQYLLLFLVHLKCSQTLESKISKTIKVRGKAFVCLFNIQYENDICFQNSTISCSPNKRNRRIARNVDLELNDGTEIIIKKLKISRKKGKIMKYEIKSSADNCGIENSKRIIGGSETAENQYPWMVRLPSGCGGSLITDRHILTAKHCLDEGTDYWRGKMVKVGVHNQNDATDYQDIPIKEVKWPKGDEHDFAMVILDRAVDLTDNTIGTVCLPRGPHEDFKSKKVVAMGWGDTIDSGSGQSPVLNHAWLTVSQDQYGPNYLYTDIGNVNNGHQSTCNGDSGGPLVYKNVRTGRWTIIGTLYGRQGKTCLTATTNIWNKITAHYDWIKEIVENTGLPCPSFNVNTQDRRDSETLQNIRSMKECSNKCRRKTTCKFWSWHHKDAGKWAFDCLLMSGYGSTNSDRNAISGAKNCKPEGYIISGISTKQVTATSGSTLWTDRSYFITQMPQELVGSTLFQPAHYVDKSTIEVFSPHKATIYVGVYEARDGGLMDVLPGQGWTLRDGWFVQWNSGAGERLYKIWSKQIEDGQTISFTTTNNRMTFAIFISEGYIISGISTKQVTATSGSTLWTDRSYFITQMPQELVGSTLFQPAHYVDKSTIEVFSPHKATIYVGVYEARDGGLMEVLPGQGWTLRDGWFVQWNSGAGERLYKIWAKQIEYGQTISFTTTKNRMTFAIFISEVTSTASTTAAAPETTAAQSGSCAVKCGVKKRGTRIVGGTEAAVNEYPWMASLSMGCGGSIIADKWIVTASHCFFNLEGTQQVITNDNIHQVAVFIGEHDKSVTTETQLPKTLIPNLVIVHPQYNQTYMLHDIALLRVPAMDLTVYTPVCLPAPGANYDNKKAWVYGWGSLFPGGPSPDALQELELTIVTDASAKQSYQSVGNTALSDAQLTSMVFAGGEEGEDSCQGDSGGPFTYGNPDNHGRHELVGAVSWGLGCAWPGLPGAYAEISAYRTWIDEQIENNGGATFTC